MEGVDLPVARVAVDVSLPHLDRVFDYAVPEAMSQTALPGVRVRVRFSGRLVDGFILERAPASDHRLQPLQRVISPVPALTPEVLQVCRDVADRYAGSLYDVLRSAVPPRHARAETAVLTSDPDPVAIPTVAEMPTAWSDYHGGPALWSRIHERGVRAVWNVAPGGGATSSSDWPTLIAELAGATAARGSGAVIVAPDLRDVARLDTALTATLGKGCHVLLTADQGPQKRYGNFLRVLTGRVRIVVGTRAAAFAPVHDPALLVLWDDGDESLSEPHAPGWHAREVLALRSRRSGASLLVGGYTRTAETQLWVETRWAGAVQPRRDLLRAAAPRVTAEDGRDATSARVPTRAWEIAKRALVDGPVLVQVARRGYVPAVACQSCRTPARCPSCAGPLALGSAGAAPACRWCATPVPGWRCHQCGSTTLRAMSVGSGRTAEELGRTFPDVRILTSGGDNVLATVADEPAVVISTPGAEPVAVGGYAAVLLLDASTQLARVALRAGEETARRWFGAAGLARPAAPVFVTAEPAVPLVQALTRWDPAWWAARDLAERAELGMPPFVRSATLTGSPAALASVAPSLPDSARTFGPFPMRGGHSRPGERASGRSDRAHDDEDRVRMLVTTPRRSGETLTRALHAIAATRSARKDPEPLQIQVDPIEWGTD